MSSKERYERLARQREDQTIRAQKEGMRQALESTDGRALLYWIISTSMEAEGKGAKQLRLFGRDILRAAMLSNWEGVQMMRQEYEQPGLRAPEEPEPEEE